MSLEMFDKRVNKIYLPKIEKVISLV